MNLEPRLQEYLQRKDFFDKNNLDQEILEKQYMITNKDKQIINMYFNKNMYRKKDLERNIFCDFIEVPKEKPKLESDNFRQDKRFQRLKNKIEMEKAAQGTRSDISELSRNYDLFNDNSNRGYASMGGNFGNLEDESSSYFDRVFPREPLNVQSFPESRKLLKQPPNPHMYNQQQSQQPQTHVEPKINYNQRVYDKQYDSALPHKPSLGNIVDDISSYKKKINNSYNFNSDSQFNSVVFNKNDCKKETMDNMYRHVGEMTGGDLRNIDIETYIKFGSPTSKAKSLGFENPVEHHFSYIDSDIQNPNHVLNDRPQLSRLSNKQNVNYKGRSLY
jgi:hypothetical protein